MNKYILLLFCFSCAQPQTFRTNSGLFVTRYFAGPSAEEIEKVSQLSVTEKLCLKDELQDIKVNFLPVKELYGKSSSFDKTVGIARNREIIIAHEFSCRALLHELVHICRRRRGINESDHDDKSIWSIRNHLISKYDKMVAKICP